MGPAIAGIGGLMPRSNERNLKLAIAAILLVVTILVALAVIALPPFAGGVY